jgi:hypothetical protein
MHKRNTALIQTVVLAVLTLTSVQTTLVPALAQTQPGANRLSAEQQGALHRYALDAWRSLVAMTLPDTGLPADNISASGQLEYHTSPTNIASSIWSTLAARDLKIIRPNEAHQSISQILNTLSDMKYHQPSGMFYHWYDPRTGALNTQMPDSRLLPAVDNGWLATALIMVRNNVPELRDKARSILDRMHFDMFYDNNPDDDGTHNNGEKRIVVDLLRGGFWDEPPPADYEGKVIPGNYAKRGSGMVFYENYHNGPLNSEPRIASYVGITKGDFKNPAKHYFTLWRTAPTTVAQQMQLGGQSRVTNGFRVFEGYYPYRGMKIVPSWGGSMFEALMVTLFVPESAWGPKSWGINHRCYVQAQIEHGLFEAKYGYWGFSPSNNPASGYGVYGVDAIGMDPKGTIRTTTKRPQNGHHPPSSTLTASLPRMLSFWHFRSRPRPCYTTCRTYAAISKTSMVPTASTMRLTLKRAKLHNIIFRLTKA